MFYIYHFFIEFVLNYCYYNKYWEINNDGVVAQQVSLPVESGSEQILQDLLRQKLSGSTEIAPLPAGELMEEFHAELTILSNEFVHQRGQSTA